MSVAPQTCGRVDGSTDPDTASSAHAADDDRHRGTPVRIGVIGAGGMAREHLASLRRLNIPAVAYSPSGRAATLAPQYDATSVRSLGALLGSVEVVDICTPTDTHPTLTLAAIDAGCHVICEKPLALTLSAAQEMVNAAAHSGVHLHIAHVVRYFEAYALAREQVRQRRIGSLTELLLRRTGPAPSAAWFHDPRRSGGVLTDQMIHDFDYARWVGGEIIDVAAELAPGDGNVVMAEATLHHAGGAVSHLRGGWLAADAVFTAAFSLRGTAGELRYSSTDGILELVDSTGQAQTWHTASDLPYDTQLADFLGAITHGTMPRVNADDALTAVDLTATARQAAATGRTIAIGDDR